MFLFSEKENVIKLFPGVKLDQMGHQKFILKEMRTEEDRAIHWIDLSVSFELH